MKNYFHFHRNPISLIIAIIIACGIYFYKDIKVSLFPEITFPKIKIIADNGEQPVDKMMISVTKPLENTIRQIPDVEIIRSTTSRGSCEISAFLKWGSDINENLEMLGLRIDEVKNQLPSSVDIKIEKMNPSILPVMGFTLESKTKTPIELNLIANHIVKPFLSQVEGVSSVPVIGRKTKEFWIEMNPQKMSSFAITPDNIISAMGQTNFITSNGYVADYRRLYLTVTNAGLYDKQDIENVIIKNDGKRIIKLCDIASVEIHEQVEYTKINANGKQALLIAIVKQPNANLIELAKNISAKKKELESILPKDVSISPYYNQADFVGDVMTGVNDCIWIGLILSILVAIMFLRSLKASSTILITIPVTLLLTITALYALGYTLNIMTFGAIAAAIGLIIDDAIVVVEQIHRSREEEPEGEIHTVVHKAVHYLLPSMIGSSISTIVIFIPFILLGGVAGAYFNVLTNTMIITLVCSFFVTWLGLPVIYLLLSKINFIKTKNHVKEIKTIKDRKWISPLIRKPYVSLIFILLLIFSVYYILPKLETGFLPEMDEGSIVLDYTSPPGTSLEETDRMLTEVEKMITSVPEVEAYSRRTGTQMGFFITEPNTGDYLIQLKKKRDRSTEEVIDDIRKKIESSQPALRIDFGQVISDMLGDLMESVQPVEIKIFGTDQDKLHMFAKQVAAEVSKVEGTADVFDGITLAGPSIEVKPNAQKLAQFNLNPANFQYQLQTQLEGNVIGSIPEKDQYTDLRLIYPDAQKSSVNRMKQQFIFLPNGKLKPVTELASIEVKEGAAEITRENSQSVVIVTARLNERDLGSVMKDIQKQIKSKISLPQGYYISYGGAYAGQEKSFHELLLILILSSLLVFTLVLFLFRDFKVAFIILLNSVIGISGSLIALFVTHLPLNVGSYTGLIMIVGIIGENAIFTFQQFKNNLKIQDAKDAVVSAVSVRLRPNLMTALGAIIALMPLALGIGTGSQLHQPLAIAVIGGFVIALPLLLVVYPAILYLVYKRKTKIN